MTRHRKILSLVGLILAVGLSAGIFSVYRAITNAYANFYALRATADLIDKHLDAHDGAWPHDWEDLARTYERSAPPNSKMMEHLKSLVDVDWNADPQALINLPEPNGDRPRFHVIWVRSKPNPNEEEANLIVWYHLQDMKKKAQTRPTSRDAR